MKLEHKSAWMDRCKKVENTRELERENRNDAQGEAESALRVMGGENTCVQSDHLLERETEKRGGLGTFTSHPEHLLTEMPTGQLGACIPRPLTTVVPNNRGATDQLTWRHKTFCALITPLCRKRNRKRLEIAMRKEAVLS